MEPPEATTTTMAMPAIRLFHVELTNSCNFKCDFCPTSVSRRPARVMPLAVFKGIVDQVADDGLAPCLLLHVLGEPLLYPDILEAVRYARGRSLRVILTTNGSLLTPDRIRGLADNGLNGMDISLQLLSAGRHAARHASQPFDQYYGRIMEAVHVIHTTTGIRLVVKALNTRYRRVFSFDGPLAFIQQGQEFRALVIRLVTDIYRTLGADIAETEIVGRLAKANLNSAVRLRLAENLFVFVQLLMDWGNAFAGGKVHPVKFGSCSFAFTAPAVLSDGSVVMCCADYDGRTVLGHIDEAPLASMLASDRARELWDAFKKGRLLHPHCQRCLGSTSRLLALGKGLGSLFVSRFMKLEGENQVIIR